MTVPYEYVETPDERLLKAEAKRALERLRNIRDMIDLLRRIRSLDGNTADLLWRAGEFDRTDLG